MIAKKTSQRFPVETHRCRTQGADPSEALGENPDPPDSSTSQNVGMCDAVSAPSGQVCAYLSLVTVDTPTSNCPLPAGSSGSVHGSVYAKGFPFPIPASSTGGSQDILPLIA